MPRPFRDRADAGRQLGSRLLHLRDKHPIVLGLPRGGVAVAFEVAQALGAPLDILNVRKLGVPWHDEIAMGAVATGGVRVLNHEVILSMGVTATELDEITRFQLLELDRREMLYRGAKPAPALTGRTVILVDDGIATGATIRSAIRVVRAQHPAAVVVAAPVAQATAAQELRAEVDELQCVVIPEDLYAVGVWYDHFDQLTDAEVRQLLATASAGPVMVG
jgi:putative phosphoribosyl transferase